ncbi:MAG: hypothetical protein V4568_14720 [Pseudomonadota bacterium]
MQKKLALFSTWQWLALCGMAIGAVTGGMVWAYATFEEKTNFERFEDHLDKRLDRIEIKIDNGLAKKQEK